MLQKPIKIRSKKLTNAAKGKSCTLRIPGVCNNNNETVVACHLPGNKGIGTKNHDIFTVDACSSCHDWADGRVKSQHDEWLSKDEQFLRALQETIIRRVNEGLITIKL